jgi:hypothetical protein
MHGRIVRRINRLEASTTLTAEQTEEAPIIYERLVEETQHLVTRNIGPRSNALRPHSWRRKFLSRAEIDDLLSRAFQCRSALAKTCP